MTPYQQAINQINQKYAGTTTTSAPPKPNLAQKVGGVVNNIAKAVVNPAARLGVQLFNVGAGLGSAVQGKMGEANAALDQPRNLPWLGETKPTLTNSSKPGLAQGLDVAGQGIQLGADAAGFGESGFGAGVINTAKTGATLGATQGFGNALTDTEGKSFGQNVGNIAGQTAIGGLTGGVIGGASAAIHPIFNRTTPIMNPEDVTAGRIADATPSYKSVLKNEDISRPITVGEGENATTMNRVDEGKGVFGKETVNPTNREIAAGTELGNVENYDTTSNLTKAQSTYKAISSEAENLKTSLQAEDKGMTPKAIEGNKQNMTEGILDNMTRQAREVVLSRGQGIEGDAVDRAGTVVGRYAQDVAGELNNYDGTRAGALEMRKNLDAIYSEARGKSAFGDTNRTALDQMHTQIRDYINNELATSSRTDVQASLAKQSKLFQAHDVLLNKAESEARSYYGRMVQKNPLLGKAANILTRQGIMVPLHVLEALAGISLAVKGATTVAKKLTGQ